MWTLWAQPQGFLLTASSSPVMAVSQTRRDLKRTAGGGLVCILHIEKKINKSAWLHRLLYLNIFFKNEINIGRIQPEKDADNSDRRRLLLVSCLLAVLAPH